MRFHRVLALTLVFAVVLLEGSRCAALQATPMINIETRSISTLRAAARTSLMPLSLSSQYTNDLDRRSFLARGAVTSSAFFIALPAFAATNINVSPLAHTFVTSSGAPKPLRENDATRFLTNARVVYLFCGSSSSDLASTVLRLTAERKADQGPGVTLGKIHVAAMSKELQAGASDLQLDCSAVIKDYVQDVAKFAKTLPDGDTLIVGPIVSDDKDGKIVDDCAKALDTSVGGAKSGGVLSVLLDGPRQDVDMQPGGYPISTILWYSVA